MTEALQRQLANDEPKCASCRHWDHFQAELTHAGICKLIHKALSEDLKDPFPAAMAVTLDLSVCSKFERKTNAQTEAETQ